MTLLKKSLLLTAATSVATLVSARPASADAIYNFSNITANNVANAAAGEAQLSVTVIDLGGGQVAFQFNNAGPLASSITDIYFDDGTLLGIASIQDGVDGDGVDFSQNASPGNLPGGSSISPAFVTTAGFSADSDPPAQPNGVNPGESLTIVFNLINGQTYNDTLAALALGAATGGLRIGIHVQGFANGGSESFVNTVPDGGTTMALLGMAMTGLGLVARRRKK